MALGSCAQALLGRLKVMSKEGIANIFLHLTATKRGTVRSKHVGHGRGLTEQNGLIPGPGKTEGAHPRAQGRLRRDAS